MRKLSVFEQITLDGYFCDANGDMGFAHKSDPEWDAFGAENAKNGGELFSGASPTNKWRASGRPPPPRQMAPDLATHMNSLPKVVFSRTLADASWQSTTLVKGDPVADVRKMKSGTGSDLVVMGSGSIVRSARAGRPGRRAQAGAVEPRRARERQGAVRGRRSTPRLHAGELAQLRERQRVRDLRAQGVARREGATFGRSGAEAGAGAERRAVVRWRLSARLVLVPGMAVERASTVAVVRLTLRLGLAEREGEREPDREHAHRLPDRERASQISARGVTTERLAHDPPARVDEGAAEEHAARPRRLPREEKEREEARRERKGSLVEGRRVEPLRRRRARARDAVVNERVEVRMARRVRDAERAAGGFSVLAAGERAADATDADEERERRGDAIERAVGGHARPLSEERERAPEAEEGAVGHDPTERRRRPPRARGEVPQEAERVVNAERADHRERKGTEERGPHCEALAAGRANEEPCRGEDRSHLADEPWGNLHEQAWEQTAGHSMVEPVTQRHESCERSERTERDPG